MTEIDEFKATNERYVADFDRGDLPMPPARGVTAVTCMDARLHEVGAAYVIRNAGGRVSDDAVRSLVISERLLSTNEVVVIHHTELMVLSELAYAKAE